MNEAQDGPDPSPFIGRLTAPDAFRREAAAWSLGEIGSPRASRPLAGLFDHYIPKNYPDLRGRKPLEVPLLMKEALMEEGVAENTVTPINDELEAVKHGLEVCRKGDFLILLLGHEVMREAWQCIRDLAARQK